MVGLTPPTPPLTELQQRLVAAARSVAERAYAPYSKFRVGAAVLCDDRIYVGTNVENASYGLTLCAERSALSAAIAAGERTVTTIAVACIDATPDIGWPGLMPCGACRQWLLELASQGEVLIAGPHNVAVLPVAALLPWGFSI